MSDDSPTLGLIGPIRELGPSDLAAPRMPMAPPPPISHLRYSHHRLAQLLANGVKPYIAARLCNYSAQRVTQLMDDPSFQELMANYKDEVDEVWADFRSMASDLSIDMMGRLREMLEEHPERFGPATILEAIKVLADRSGNAPVTKTVSVAVTTDIGDQLLAARARIRDARSEAA